MSKRTIRVAGGVLIWDDGEIGVMLRSQSGDVAGDVRRRVYAVQKRMKRLAPVWSGALRSGIRAESIESSPTGPVGRVVSDAEHTIVAEVGRRAVVASGLQSPSQRPQKFSMELSKSKLRWGNGTAQALTIRLAPGGIYFFSATAGPADGARFMERSIDAAVD